MPVSAVNIEFGGLTVRNNPIKIIVFTDWSLGNGPNRSTIAGYIVYLTDGSAEYLETNIKANMLAWLEEVTKSCKEYLCWGDLNGYRCH